MADRKLVKYKIVIGLALASSIFVYSQITLAYSTLTTHRAITNESAKFFNTYYSTQEIPLDQINSLTKGSADEDTPPRWLNHFYDPVHQAGFRGLRSSKAWAEDTSAQAGWVNKNPLAEYFSASGDYSWERAIYDYVYADKNRAMEALGHTLHLIQDATVPDHTRDDAHPIWSTYESYAKQFEMANTNLSDKLINQKQSPIIFANLSEYFDYLARFSNNNFFSDDTILYSGYPKPVIDKEIIEKLSDGKNYKFGVNDLGKLSLIHESFNKNSGDIEKTYTMIDVDQKIPSDYWLNLSPKATLASAGVIKLFFDEVEKEKQSKKLFEKNNSLAENFLANLNGKLGGLLAGVALVNSSPNPSSSTPSLVATTSDIIATTTEEAIMLETNQTEIDRLYENLQKLKIQLEQIIAERLSQGAQSLVATTTQTLANTRQIISGGGSSFTSAIEDITNPTISSDAIVIPSPIIISPVDFSQSFATTSIIFSGTSLPGLVIFVFDNLNKIQATTSDTGEWTLTLVNLRQGSSTIKFFARDENGNASLPTEVNFNINSLPLAINFSINQLK
ncbi:MAG: hypothetical protein NT041_00205 [Candidatus Vogelbacteria bacterium]|nr:hypothetical protein [Candidatus Vogelbacteria bacterium]